MQVLSLNKINKQIKDKIILKDISFTLEEGEILGLLGPNGAGKSTLMKCLLGIEEYDTGRISIDSVDTIGYMQQQSDFTHDNLYDELLSAFADIIALGQKKTTLEKQIENLDDDDKLEDLMKEYSRISDKFEQLGGYDYESRLRRVAFGLGFSEEDFPKNPTLFSGGQRTRICLAKALLREPDFLFLDEPTNGLDPTGIKEIRELIQKLNHEHGITVLISSHILGELSKLATRYGIIDKGVMIDEFTAEDLEARCKSSLMIQVDRIPEACSILENVVGTKNYTVNPDGTISLFDHLDEAGLINTILAKHDIIVNSISMSNADLENYFIQVTGGDR